MTTQNNQENRENASGLRALLASKELRIAEMEVEARLGNIPYKEAVALKQQLTSLQQLLVICKGALNRWVIFFDSQNLPVQPIYWEQKLKYSKELLTLLEKEGVK